MFLIYLKAHVTIYKMEDFLGRIFTEILVNFHFFYPLNIVAFLNADS